MKLGSRLLVLLACALVNVSAQGGAASQSPTIGNWKVRAAAPAHGTRQYEDRGGGVVVSTRQGVSADGRPYFSQYAAKYDGKEYPRAVKGSATANTIAFEIVDADTLKFTLRADGKIISRGTTHVTKDRKVLTVTTWPEGSPESRSEEVYDRQ